MSRSIAHLIAAYVVVFIGLGGYLWWAIKQGRALKAERDQLSKGSDGLTHPSPHLPKGHS